MGFGGGVRGGRGRSGGRTGEEGWGMLGGAGWGVEMEEGGQGMEKKREILRFAGFQLEVVVSSRTSGMSDEASESACWYYGG